MVISIYKIISAPNWLQPPPCTPCLEKAERNYRINHFTDQHDTRSNAIAIGEKAVVPANAIYLKGNPNSTLTASADQFAVSCGSTSSELNSFRTDFVLGGAAAVPNTFLNVWVNGTPYRIPLHLLS